MTEKNKQRLLVAGLIVLGLIILWLILNKNSAAVPATASPTVENNQGAGQLPTSSGPASALTSTPYNFGSIPSLAGLNMPGFNLSIPSTTQACCSSCGCDATSPLNQFAAGVGAALSNYASQMNTLESNYQTSLFGELPTYISQYISTAAPSTPVSVIGA